MERRLPLFTDNHVRQPIVTALRARGWTVVRSIDVFPERTKDDVLFEHAAQQGLVFVTSDQGVHVIPTVGSRRVDPSVWCSGNLPTMRG